MLELLIFSILVLFCAFFMMFTIIFIEERLPNKNLKKTIIELPQKIWNMFIRVIGVLFPVALILGVFWLVLQSGTGGTCGAGATSYDC